MYFEVKTKDELLSCIKSNMAQVDEVLIQNFISKLEQFSNESDFKDDNFALCETVKNFDINEVRFLFIISNYIKAYFYKDNPALKDFQNSMPMALNSSFEHN